MSRRSQFEIYIDILKAVSEGRSKPTHIMYRANLTYKRLRKYIDFLVAQGLLSERSYGKNKFFSLTLNGKNLIWYYMEIEREILQKRIQPQKFIIQSIGEAKKESLQILLKWPSFLK
ncbi:MAG: winged helix-turn-helix domain-containing protein [Candidatus Jordarchaeaceae archaeon]